MNKDIFQGNWSEFKGKIKEKWGKFTNDDLTEINGQKEKLFGKLQSLYGYSKEKAEKELSELEQSCGCQPKNKKK